MGLLQILKNLGFLMILPPAWAFWKFEDPYFGQKSKFSKKATYIIQSELYWSIAPGVYRLLVNTQISSFWAIFGNFGSVHGIFSDSRTKNRWKIKIFQIRSIEFLIIIITNHKPKIRSIGSFLVSSIDFEWTHYCSKWANFRLFLYIKCLQVHELKVV